MPTFNGKSTKNVEIDIVPVLATSMFSNQPCASLKLDQHDLFVTTKQQTVKHVLKGIGWGCIYCA